MGYDSYDHPLEAGDPELIAAELERLKAEVEPSDIYRSADFTGTAAQDGSDITLEMDLTTSKRRFSRPPCNTTRYDEAELGARRTA